MMRGFSVAVAVAVAVAGCATDDAQRWRALPAHETDRYFRCQDFMLSTCSAARQRATGDDVMLGVGVTACFAGGLSPGTSMQRGSDVTCIRTLQREYATVRAADRPLWLVRQGCPRDVAGYSEPRERPRKRRAKRTPEPEDDERSWPTETSSGRRIADDDEDD